jgi:hypothetical protein
MMSLLVFVCNETAMKKAYCMVSVKGNEAANNAVKVWCVYCTLFLFWVRIVNIL